MVLINVRASASARVRVRVTGMITVRVKWERVRDV